MQTKTTRQCGREAEQAAVAFLRAQGYRIRATNYRTRFAEIDIIAQEQRTTCFIEVKARHSVRFGLAAEAVTPAKQRRIFRAAQEFLRSCGSFDTPARFDVVSVTYPQEGQPRCQLIKGAFCGEGTG